MIASTPARLAPRASSAEPALPDDLDRRTMEPGDRIRMSARVIPKEGDGLDRRIGQEVDDSGSQEGDEQVNRQRLFGAAARGSDFVQDTFGSECGQTDRPEPSGFGNGGGQFGERHRAHPGANDPDSRDQTDHRLASSALVEHCL